jgi:HD-like signal output (HDOD) protein
MPAPTARPPTLDEVGAQALSLPCAPTLLPRLVAALQKDEGTADEIESIIRLDTALTAATLRLANSAFYSGTSVDTVAEAIMRLGQREIYRLAALALVCRWDGGQMRALRWEPGDFSRHTLCTALAAEALAEATGRLEPQSAYTAGLVCDMGKLALAHSCADLYGAVRARCEGTSCTWSEAEKAVFGYTHAEAGAKLLQTWRFPELLVQAVRFQDEPESAPVGAHILLGHLSAARYLAASMGPGVGEDAYRVTVHGTFLQAQGFTSEILEAALPLVLERAASRLGDKLTNGIVTI